MNIYFDIGGAKGKGLKKKHNYEKIAKEKGRKLKALHQFGSTRFRSYRICIEPILFNWETIVDYYSSLDKPTPRQTKLKEFFVIREFDSLLKLEFIMAATKDLNEAINYFEGRDNKIHLARSKMEEVLRGQLLKFMKPSLVNNIDEMRNIRRKSGPELLEIDVHQEESCLNRNQVFVGQKCSQIMRVLDLTPSSIHVDLFYDLVWKFHKKVAVKLQGYFKKGLSSLELEYMAAFSPTNRTKETTTGEIMFLATRCSKILDNIRPGDGFDKLKNEIQIYQADDDINYLDKGLSYNDYWSKVAEVTEGTEGWQVYDVLPRLARVLGSAFNSGSEMERRFSVQSDIVRDPKRNRMSHETLDSHVQIRFGVECEKSRRNCTDCKTRKEISRKEDFNKTDIEKRIEKGRCLCHCKVAEISDAMKLNCSKARSEYGRIANNSQPEGSDSLPEEELENKNKEGRILKLKQGMKKRTTLYKADDMKKIYTTKEDKKKEALAKKAELAKQKLKKQLEEKDTEKHEQRNTNKEKSAPAVRTKVPALEKAGMAPAKTTKVPVLEERAKKRKVSVVGESSKKGKVSDADDSAVKRVSTKSQLWRRRDAASSE